jgi:ABC-2 type transport system permease protein
MVKDTLDAMKNKTVLGIIVGVAFLMLSSQVLPFIMKANAKPRAVFFDQGKSTAIREIVRSRDLDFHQNDSFQEMIQSVGASSIPILGLVVPQDFDLQIKDGSIVVIEGYSIHWARSSEISSLIAHFEESLSDITGQKIHIEMSDEEVFPDIESVGFTIMIITGMVTGVMTIGLILVPLLITEEIENHTLDALLISPAKTIHIFIGKSLTGLVYSIMAAVVMFIFTWNWIVHWHVMVVAVILGGLCSVTLGLFLGSLSNTATTINLWVGIAIMVLLIPVFLWSSIPTKLSPALIKILNLLPSVAMSNLINNSFREGFLFSDVFLDILILISFGTLMSILVIWRIWRMDR